MKKSIGEYRSQSDKESVNVRPGYYISALTGHGNCTQEYSFKCSERRKVAAQPEN
jgi:hypothetical protein